MDERVVLRERGIWKMRREQWLPVLVLILVIVNVLFVLFSPDPPIGDRGTVPPLPEEVWSSSP